jgi:hypothetical protein
MDTKMIGVWAFIIGLALAMATVFFDLGSWVVQALIVLGILVGIFHPIRKEVLPLGMVYLTLTVAASSMDELLLLGPIVTDIASAWVGFLGPAVLTAMLMWGSPYLMAKK